MKVNCRSRLCRVPKKNKNTDLFFYGFGVPLDRFWHPVRRLLGILGAFRPPSGSLLASLRLSFRQPLEAFRSAENLPSFRRELAEVIERCDLTREHRSGKQKLKQFWQAKDQDSRKRLSSNLSQTSMSSSDVRLILYITLYGDQADRIMECFSEVCFTS